MIQLVFKSVGKIVPEWEGEQERLFFRLAPANARRGDALHKQMDEAGAPAPDDEAVGVVTLGYEGDLAREVQLILELPDEVWDNLANWADDLLDEDMLDEDQEALDDDWEDDF